MTEREFWIEVRRALTVLIKAITARYIEQE